MFSNFVLRHVSVVATLLALVVYPVCFAAELTEGNACFAINLRNVNLIKPSKFEVQGLNLVKWRIIISKCTAC